MAEVLGGAFLSAFCDFLLDKISSPQLLDLFLRGRKRKRIEEVVQKLKINMDSFQGVLNDAEEKKMTRSTVKEWLDELKDAFYQADDLLDEIDYEAVRLKMEADSQTTADRVWNLLSSLNPFNKDEMEAKLEEILATLDRLAEQKDRLGLRVGVGEKPFLLSQDRTPTTSLVDESGIYGRDADKEAVMELVLRASNGVDVIPIVGMGGIGKTTLAQLVYKDGRLQGFNLKAWVCISLEFDVFRITKDILKELGLSNCDNLTPNQLHLELEEKVRGKKFLLVLDDVWNEKYEDWDNLRKPLLSGAPGSKIVVTTRDESVASIMCRSPIHHLKALRDDECLSLFVKHALGDENLSAHPELKEIARGIVGKCKGLPLAAKIVGGLLSSTRRDVTEWREILKNKLWDLAVDNILPALMLSYYYLPSHLKRCFSFCAIFPQDYAFREEEVILLWMAEGLIDQPQGNKEIEEVAREYFHDLVSRSFFQQRFYGSVAFVMHDLIIDLAKSTCGEFCCRLEADNQVNIGRRIRHLSFDNASLEKLQAIKSAVFLRTLLLKWHLRWSWHLEPTSSIDNVLLDLLPKLSCLRTLSLPRYISLVPDSVGHMKHLRYLNLEGALIKSLPDHITSLYFLQTLILSGCWNLIILPVGMARLINLCHLDITGTKLQEMPPQMGKLTRLQCLTDFFLGNNSGSNIKELGGLKHLRGELRIWNLQHVADALEANLKDQEHLQKLELIWNGDTKGSEHDRDVPGQLQLHTNLEVLTINGYGGTRFPNWIGDSSLSNVVTLNLRGRKYCSTIPPIGQLSSLKNLRIEDFEAVEVIGPEFYGSNTSMKKPFGSLETLQFKGLPKWEEWKQLNNSGDEDESGVFPHLRKLYIEGCRELTKTLPGHLPSLETLEIKGSPVELFCSIPRGGAPTLNHIKWTSQSSWNVGSFPHGCKSGFYMGFDPTGFRSSHGQLVFWAKGVHCIGSVMERIGYSSTIGEIRIEDCGGLECLQLELFPNLITLCLKSCPDLKFISACQSLTSLTSLEISLCFNLISFREGGLSAPNLKTISIKYLSKLESLDFLGPQYQTSLEELIITDCSQIHSMPTEGLPSTLKSLSIDGLTNLKSLDFLGPQYLTSLEKLDIYDLLRIRSMPTEGLPSTLKSLSIRGLTNLKSLDFLGRQYLTSLEILLYIGFCDEIHSMPTEGLPSTLKSLAISGLSNLKSLDFLYLQYLTSLEKLQIKDCPQISSMPTEGLPSTLTSLFLCDLPDLKSLDCKGFQQLTSLSIFNCPKLQCLPHEGLPLLSFLSISKCPVLEQRCQRDEGEDWHKISDISRVEINYQII